MKAFLLLWLDKLSRWIRNVLSDDGNQSSTRLVFLASWGSVLLVHLVLSLQKGCAVPIDSSELALLTIATGGKAWDKHIESRS